MKFYLHATLHKTCAHLKLKHYGSTHGPSKEVVPQGARTIK